MKRDMDLVRDILKFIEAAPSSQAHITVRIDGHSHEDVREHLIMMKDAGMIEVPSKMLLNVVLRLTWEGHEFLEKIRDETVWSRIKSIAIEKTGGLSFDVLKAVAKAYVVSLVAGSAP